MKSIGVLAGLLLTMVAGAAHASTWGARVTVTGYYVYATGGALVCASLAILAGAGCNYYLNPYVDLVVRARDVETGSRIGPVVAEAARQRKLIAWKSSPPGMPLENRRNNEKTIHYLTGTNVTEGVGIDFFDASPVCKVVRVIERSRTWTAQTQATLTEVRATLESIDGVTVEAGDEFDQATKSSTRALNEYCTS